jgi:hypothetical protein
MFDHRGRKQLPFGEAIRAEINGEPIHIDHGHGLLPSPYVRRGLYAEQVERIWHLFPREQTLVLKSEQFFRQPRQTLECITSFLNLPPMPELREKIANAYPYEKPIDNRDWQYLRDFYAPHIRKLEAMLGWDCSEWLQRV